jgi:hypothetical protein
MPRLLIFAPCEKVIVDQQGNPSLISLLQEWQADRRDLPEKAVAPQRWDIFCLWHRVESDNDKDFVQTCELLSESGQKVLSADIEFRMTAVTHRNTVTVLGLPVNPGRYDLALYLHEKGSEKERERLALYPLNVTVPSA